MTLRSMQRSLETTYYTDYDFNELMLIIKNADGCALLSRAYALYIVIMN